MGILEIKGDIKHEKGHYHGISKWVELTIGQGMFKQGEVLINPKFGGLEKYQQDVKLRIRKEIDSMKNRKLVPLLRMEKDLSKQQGTNRQAIVKIKREKQILETQIKALENSLKSDHELVGKKFRLIIYDV